MSFHDSTPSILEVTLRDGSYLVDFQFTADDTATTVAALESLGFRWIEVGHGLGLNASASGKGQAAASDEEYLAAAAEAANDARWGMFFIPGIGRDQDLRLAAAYGMSFVRIGADITQVEKARPFIELARQLDMCVSYNAMKSYAVSAADFGRIAAMVHGWGAQVVCLVDSAGGMYPDDVCAYLDAARGESDAALGFHGHDNLSLAMANTLAAVDAGAALVDSSLQGIGRSAGNAVTEVLVAVLKKRGLIPEIDLNAVLDLGQSLIQPALRRRGMEPLAVTAGMARFHSSHTPKLQQYASRFGLDVRDLIARLCREDLVNAPDELLEKLSRELAAARVPRVVATRVFGVDRPRPGQGRAALTAVIKEVRARALQQGKFSALNIAIGDTPRPEFHVSGNVQNTVDHVVGSAVVSDESQLREALELLDGQVRVVMLDVDRKPSGPAQPATVARQCLRQSSLLTYSDTQLWVDAIEDQVVRLLDEVLDDVPVVLAGDHPGSRILARRLSERGAKVCVLSESRAEDLDPEPRRLSGLSQAPEQTEVRLISRKAAEAALALAEAQMVVVWTKEQSWFGSVQVQHLRANARVLDCLAGAVLPEGLEEARHRGIELARINIWPVLAGSLSAGHESLRVRRDAFGWDEIAGVPVAAGGAMGRDGDVIVDSVGHPTRVIGVADGRGGIRFDYQPDEASRVRRVSEQIARHLRQPDLTSEPSAV